MTELRHQPTTADPAAPEPLPGPAAAEQPAPKRRHTARWIAGGMLIVVAALVAVLATRPSYTTLATPNASLGKIVVPASQVGRNGQPKPGTIILAGTTLTGGHLDLASYRGRWVVVNFFASWCAPCQHEEPDLITWAFEHRGPNAPALVGVVVNDTPAAAATYQRLQGATWPSLADANGHDGVEWAVTGQPETFLVAPDGRVMAHFAGPLTVSELDAALAKAQSLPQ